MVYRELLIPVALLPTPCRLNTADKEELQAAIPPLSPSMHYGIDLYERTLMFVGQKVGHTL